MMDLKSPEARRVGRLRTFDPEAALESAMRVFWEHGYEATSLAVLRESMGLTAPQIYSVFTSKENLFRMALARYLQREAGFAIRALSAPIPAKQAIHQLLRGAAEAYTVPGKPGGCLFVLGALAVSYTAQPIADELRRCRKSSEAAIAERMHKGVRAGELPPTTDCVALAKYFAGVVHGMSIQARDGSTKEDLLRLADTALLAWPTAKRGPHVASALSPARRKL